MNNSMGVVPNVGVVVSTKMPQLMLKVCSVPNPQLNTWLERLSAQEPLVFGPGRNVRLEFKPAHFLSSATQQELNAQALDEVEQYVKQSIDRQLDRGDVRVDPNSPTLLRIMYDSRRTNPALNAPSSSRPYQVLASMGLLKNGHCLWWSNQDAFIDVGDADNADSARDWPQLPRSISKGNIGRSWTFLDGYYQFRNSYTR